MAQTLKPEKREAILKAARTLFCTFGYNETGMRDIAQEAGMTCGNIYHYFDDKEEIYLEIKSDGKDYGKIWLAMNAVKNLTEYGFLITELADKVPEDVLKGWCKS